MQVSAKMTIAKIAAGPKATETRAKAGAAKIRTASEKMPPNSEAKVAQPMARSALPARAIGYPSSTVAADCGVPGVLIRIAEIEPPYTDVT